MGYHSEHQEVSSDWLEQNLIPRKEEGGLGFWDLRTLNRAYMLRLGWHMLECPSKLWVHIMKAKYGCGLVAMPEVRNHTNSSRTWLEIVTGWHLVQQTIRWVIRNGHGVRFWRDHWIPRIFSLSDLLGNHVPGNEVNFSVSHYAKDGSWNWLRLHQYLDDDICQQIAIIKPPAAGLDNFPCWDLSNDGLFTLKSAYQVVMDADGIEHE